MSTLPTLDPQTQPGTPARAAASKPLLICLPSLPTEAATALIAQLGSAFHGEHVLVASPDHTTEQPAEGGLPTIVPYPEPRSDVEWVLGSEDFLAAARLAEERSAAGILLLGDDAASLHPLSIRNMQAALAEGADLAMPRYETAPDDGLVNSALLYPVTRALFGANIRFPLPLDAGLSPRMLQRLSAVGSRLSNSGDGPLLWPVAEASVAGFTVRQVEGGPRVLPQPQEADLNTLFPAVTASLFADIESKASYWQRARAITPTRPNLAPQANAWPADPETADEVRSLVENFRLAFGNLREIWSLVLPPQSLLALKKLSLSPVEQFSFPPALWARTVFDFALAFHMRTLNRGHLLGALTPLYLAWVASFLRNGDDVQGSTDLLELTAAAFDQEKPYLVARWRWPDRFNP